MKNLIEGHEVASRRILRLALGAALSMAYSQIVSWPLSFIAPVFTLLLLALPIPAPSLSTGIKFVVALLLPVAVGMTLLPFLYHMRWVGIALLGLCLFYSFYFTARGGSAILGTFITIGLTLVVTIGSVSIDVMMALIGGLAAGAVFGMIFVWLAHAFIPDPPPQGPARPKPPAPEIVLSEARRKAWRAMLITFPAALVFLFASGSPAYTVVMIKVASMGQQANSDKSREMGRSLMLSTVWGGIGAVIAWQVLSIWPSLVMYTLLIGLAGLVYGRQIFQGKAMHPDFSMWSYAYLTMVVVIAPAVMDGLGGSTAGAAFWSRLLLFMIIAVYGSVSVAVFDAFWPAKTETSGEASIVATPAD